MKLANVSVEGGDYRILFWYMSKDDTTWKIMIWMERVDYYRFFS